MALPSPPLTPLPFVLPDPPSYPGQIQTTPNPYSRPGTLPEKHLRRISEKVGFDITRLPYLTRTQARTIDLAAREVAQEAKAEVARQEEAIRKNRKIFNDIIALMEADYNDRPDHTAKIFPTLYREYYPRNIITPKGWYNPRNLAGTFASATMMRMEYNHETARHQIEGIILAGYLWSRIKCPTYFLSEGLGRAVAATTIAADHPLPPDLKWPLPAFAVMLPEGALNIEGKDVATIILARFPTKEPIQINKPKLDGGSIDRVSSELWRCPPLVFRPSPASGPWSQSVTVVMANGDTMTREIQDGRPISDLQDRSHVMADSQEGSQTLVDDRSSPALVFAVKLLLILQHSPGLVDQHHDVVHEPGQPRRTQFDPKAKWSPKFLGRDYRMRGEGTGTGTGKTPHIRLGHIRNQPYGPMNVSPRPVRERWIEPIIVNGSKWKPGDPLYVVDKHLRTTN